MRPPLLTHLRAGTADLHTGLDTAVMPTLRTLHDLRTMLTAMLRAWVPLERALAAVPGWPTLGLDPHLGEASGLLATDVTALGGVPDVPLPVPAFATTAHAVGGRYVLLGSAMGGRVLARHTQQHLGLGTGPGMLFLQREGMRPGRDWRVFLGAIADLTDPDVVADAVAGARATFLCVTDAVADGQRSRREPAFSHRPGGVG